MTSKLAPEHGIVLYQLTQEDLLAFGERIFRNLWEQVSTKTVTKVGRKTLVSTDDFDSIVASGELRKFKHHPTVKKEGGRNYGR